jgi:hypothetical protein
MTTTTATIAGLVDAHQLSWEQDDWLDSYTGDDYASSVIWAAQDACRLAAVDLEALFRAHGADVEEYRSHLLELCCAGLPVLHLRHAGQALTWLGY